MLIRPEKKRHPVQRAPSRLYQVDRNNPRQDKYRGPTTCIGPEFVVRAANPARVIHIGDIKVSFVFYKEARVVLTLYELKKVWTEYNAKTVNNSVIEIFVCCSLLFEGNWLSFYLMAKK